MYTSLCRLDVRVFSYFFYLCIGYVCTIILVVLFFFFFKQKTAYEMRISDWSSDVCSSDLIGVALREMAAMKEGLRSALRQRTRLAALGTAVNKISHDLRNMLATATLISDRLALSQDPEVQRIKIGRASCRERVCQYG